jgi:hypothetical protein
MGTQKNILLPRPRQAHRAAFYGLAGQIVGLIEPHSEADPMALLSQFLVAFGNCAGRSAHFNVEADSHYSNLNLVVVGQTAKGRKGTSWGYIKRLFEQVDENWACDRIEDGLSTGEGLIWAVHDDGNAIDDKRLLVMESEFGKVLSVIARQGNILSAVVRQAWDSGNLRTLTRTNPLKATAAHISIIGHITARELRKNLTATEVANGFANRFLWLTASRSKCLPEGGQFNLNSFNSSISLLREAVIRARDIGEVRRSDQARELWRKVYPVLSAGSDSLSGAVISRAEAQTMRLALLFALVDQSDTIRVQHLRAALAVWCYCENSARSVFGEGTGDKRADALVTALRTADPEGMTKTDIMNHFNRNLTADAIESALRLLDEQGRINSRSEQTGGRAAVRYFLVEHYEHELNEVNEVSQQASVPQVVTELMRERLRDCGETDEEIDKMTPAEAHALMEYFESFNPVG